MSFGYFSDIHLDIYPESLKKIVSFSRKHSLREIFLTGDISNSFQIEHHLRLLSKYYDKIYFVLGNHCYFGSNFFDVEDKIKRLTAMIPQLCWVTQQPPIQIKPNIAIIGSEGWMNVKSEAFKISLEKLAISNIENLNIQELKNSILEYKFIQASKRYDRIICLTHFPPVARRKTYFDRIYQSYHENYDLKTILDKQTKSITVYSGHTHNNFDYYSNNGWHSHTIAPSFQVLNRKNIITL